MSITFEPTTTQHPDRPACRHPNSCHRHGHCMYFGCPHNVSGLLIAEPGSGQASVILDEEPIVSEKERKAAERFFDGTAMDPNPDYIRDISEFVLRSRLSRNQRTDLDRKGILRERAAAFDAMTVMYLDAIRWRGEQ